VADSPRIEELRRRLLKDPASIAFAQLAEEHRRAGDLDEAVRVAEVGLDQHSGYLSARVTLGRALLELGRLDEAGAEFARVVEAAPDNLIAVRALADIHQRTRKTTDQRRSEAADEPPAGDVHSTTGFASEAEAKPEPVAGTPGSPAPSDPVAVLASVPDGVVEAPDENEVADAAAAADEPAADELADGAPGPEADATEVGAEEPEPPHDPLVVELETWLAVLADRAHA
jgi:tetratricopeptide (TPR) repeat protein